MNRYPGADPLLHLFTGTASRQRLIDSNSATSSSVGNNTQTIKSKEESMLDCRQHAMIAARNHIFSASTMRPIAIACSRNGVASVLKHFSNPWSHQGSDNTCLPPPPLPPLRHRRPESGLASKAANPALLQLPPLAEQQEAGGRPVLSAALRQPLTLRRQKRLQHHTPHGCRQGGGQKKIPAAAPKPADLAPPEAADVAPPHGCRRYLSSRKVAARKTVSSMTNRVTSPQKAPGWKPKVPSTMSPETRTPGIFSFGMPCSRRKQRSGADGAVV